MDAMYLDPKLPGQAGRIGGVVAMGVGQKDMGRA